MGDKSAIQWTDATWNPVTGCSKVSPGCAHCYAESITERYAGRSGWITEHRPWTPANAAHNVVLRPERLDQPLRWRRPQMVFVNSMSDLFHEEIPDDFIASVFAVMGSAPQHTFQVLTKRAERMRDFLGSGDFIFDVERACVRLGLRAPWADRDLTVEDIPALPNVWLGVSIENRRFVHRADLLRETPAAVRFISAEPLLGPLFYDDSEAARSGWRTGPELDLFDIDWLIVGGESGPTHRPMRSEWVRELRDTAIAFGTSFFFKQWGGRTPKSGGRELDGRTWDEMPSTDPEPLSPFTPASA